MKKNKKMLILTLFAIFCLGILFSIISPRFGGRPKGARLERCKQSPNYQNGQFVNQEPTRMFTSDKHPYSLIGSFLKRDKQVRPQQAIEVDVPDLKHLDSNKELYVWFGHSTYLLQTGGNMIVVDPVFLLRFTFFVHQQTFSDDLPFYSQRPAGHRFADYHP